jgi:AcrR family transcriptional regulator
VSSEVRESRRSDARDNRVRVLQAAREAFAAGGLQVTIREIARRSGVSAATIYRHFGAKDELLSAAFADQTASCSSILQEGLDAQDAWAGFCLAFDRLVTVHALDRGFARGFTTRLAPGAEATTDRDRTTAMLMSLIRRAQRDGSMRSDLRLQDVVVALMAHEGIRAGSPAQHVAASRRLAALLLQSFRANPVVTPLPPASAAVLASWPDEHEVSAR